MKKRKASYCFSLVSTVLLLSILFNMKAYAADICVDPLIPACHNSIQEGIDAAVSGDTVQVASGTYIEQIILKSGITLQGENRYTTFIWSNSSTVTGSSVYNTVVHGFTITSGSGHGMYLTNCDVTVNGNIFEGSAGEGIKVVVGDLVPKTHYVDITNNIIEDNNDGISITTTYRRNIDGFIWNNIVVKNRAAGIRMTGDHAVLTKAVNNVVYENAGDGIRLACAGTPYISNNIVIQNGNYGISQSTSALPTVAYNNVYKNAVADYDGVTVGPGSISVDPEFVDEANENFHLLPTSPAIDAGNSVNSPPDDIDGDSRPQGGGYDMGADEYNQEPCADDLDEDGHQDVACGGDDCNDSNKWIYLTNTNPYCDCEEPYPQGTEESEEAGNCDDDVDNDCDGLVDNCGNGCMASAAASTIAPSPIYESYDLAKHLVYLLLPMGAVLGLIIWRRKR